MPLPMSTQILDGKGKGRIHIPDKNEGFVLSSVGMKRIAVAKAVRIIVANDGHPVFFDANLQLHGKALNRFSSANVRATQTCIIRRQLYEPMTFGRLRFTHGSLLAGWFHLSTWRGAEKGPCAPCAVPL